MLEIHRLEGEKEAVIAGITKKGVKEAQKLVEAAIELNSKRKSSQQQLDELLAQSNAVAKSIGMLMKQGKTEEATDARNKAAQSKAGIAELKAQLEEFEIELKETLYQIPNVPHPSVPEGKSDQDNQVVFTQENAEEELLGSSIPHWELITKYDIIDFDLGNKITGAGFPVYKGKGARLQRALINFFLDEAEKAGYREMLTPILVNEESGFGTGQLPDKEGQMYHVQGDNLYVIPTGEVPITNIYRNVIIDETELPIKNVGYTPCFRREAGSWGADVRGLNRLHQFDKVEIVQVVKPEDSYNVLEEMKSHVEGLLQKLELPYRTLNLCGGDISFTSALTFDFEVFSRAQKRWLEVSSISNFETYQATRLKLRLKDGKKKRLAHTLNGSALALPRILASILENNQTEEGIKIPKVLIPYTGFDVIN